MQQIKSVIIGMGVLALFLCAFTFFIPKQVTVTRGIAIGIRRDSLQAFLEDLPQWPRWCSWMGQDSVITRSFTAAAPGRQATITWFPNGRPEGKAFISILQAVPGDIRLFYQFKNLQPASGGFTLTEKKGPGGDSTFVQWTLEVHLRWYPWEKLSGIAMDKVWGKSMLESLRRLKSGVYGEAVVKDEDEDAPGK